jgi:hypothetical protein
MDDVGEGVDMFRLSVADDDQSQFSGPGEILGHSGHPAGRFSRRRGRAGRAPPRREALSVVGGQLVRHRQQEVAHLSASHPQGVVGSDSGDMDPGTDCVEAVHLLVGALQLTRRLEEAGVAVHLAFGAEEVAVEAENDARLVGVDQRLSAHDPDAGGSGRCVVCVSEVMTVEGRLRKSLREASQDALKGRGGVPLDQEREAFSLLGGGAISEALDGVEAPLKRGLSAVHQRGPAALWGVEVHHRGLCPRVRGAPVAGMAWVSFDLDRPSILTLDGETENSATDHHAGGVVDRMPGDQILGSLAEGEDVLHRFANAARHGRGGSDHSS